ncbi:MAG: NUDIX hydrolase [Anaerosomatales bacterium]|nr:NUDIX hydrolase [Anaerosomatales bacterium]MDT8433340.1 NUDIX hydrolase [Anaerosomatales bacterium]
MAAPACDHPRIRVAALLVIDGKVLLVRHLKNGRRYHLLPGGGVERGESLAEALSREIAEETGLVAEIGRPLFLNDTIDPSGDRHIVNITFGATVAGGCLATEAPGGRIEGLDLVEPSRLTSLDLRPPIASQLLEAIDAGGSYRATYLGSLFTEE